MEDLEYVKKKALFFTLFLSGSYFKVSTPAVVLHRDAECRFPGRLEDTQIQHVCVGLWLADRHPHHGRAPIPSNNTCQLVFLEHLSMEELKAHPHTLSHPPNQIPNEKRNSRECRHPHFTDGQM